MIVGKGVSVGVSEGNGVWVGGRDGVTIGSLGVTDGCGWRDWQLTSPKSIAANEQASLKEQKAAGLKHTQIICDWLPQNRD